MPNEESTDLLKRLERMVAAYEAAARLELETRWRAYPVDGVAPEVSEVLGGLLARQVTLAIEVGRSPGIWNGHVAPIILRTMVDLQITLVWIMKDRLARSRQFIAYGLGQQKLELEHLKADADPKDETRQEMLKKLADSLNVERYTFLTEVNVGNWAGANTRKMAEEAGCLSIYRFVYTPFSAATHSMWHHIYRYNLVRCNNPLHGAHRTPAIADMAPDLHYFFLAATYLKETFEMWDKELGVTINAPSAFNVFGEMWNIEHDSEGAGGA